MRDAIRKAIVSLFPELSGGLHLPLYGRVAGISESMNDEAISNNFRGRYAVNIEILDANDKPDKSYTLFKNIVLPLPFAGFEAGGFKYPENGTRVVLGFAGGLPHMPFIQQLFPNEQSLPKVDVNELVLQARPGVLNKADRKGNLISNTFAKIINKSHSREIEATENTEQYRTSLKTVDGFDIEEVHNKVVEAIGSVRIAAAGLASMESGDSFSVTTARDLNEVAAKKRVALAGESQSFKSPKTYIGSDTHNVLKIVSDIAQAVNDLASACASHKHTDTSVIGGGSGGPATLELKPTTVADNASSMSSAGTSAGTQKINVDGITL